MPEPFKNLFNKSNIRSMGEHYTKAWPEFDLEAFVAAATKDLESLELKERSAQITESMATYLPTDFEKAAAIMLASLAPVEETNTFADVDERGIAGFLTMSMAHYLGLHGLGHFDISINLLKEMTIRFTSEFGIRFFLLDDPVRTLSVLEGWTADPNQHVRRLVSEGSRTRLPWAMRLPAFIADPSPVIRLLELLKDDDEEYVRRSVANNLNDIAKDHPDLVAEIASRWLKGADKNRERLVRHACRTLIKQGHQATLKAFGYNKAHIEVDQLELFAPSVAFGSALEFELSLKSASAEAQPLIIDYAIHHQKANGSTSPKVFKWKTLTLEGHATLVAKRKHPMKKITTRVYYPGTHKLEILINGTSVGMVDFELII